MDPGAFAHPVWQRLERLVNWERAERARMRVDVSPELDLVARLGHPQRRYRTVPVTGTKGKGSVCALLESALLAAGWRAGRYASPHLEHFGERVSLAGQPIADDDFARALERAFSAYDAAIAEGTPAREASWFDLVTAAAFVAFADAGMEWVVVEVGLGGRLDSTNVVVPKISIVTNIGLEHVDVLGATEEAIAAEKAGIFKAQRPALTMVAEATPAGRVLAEVAARVGAPLTWLPSAAAAGVQAQNVALARAALDILGRQGVASRTRGAPLAAADLPDALADAVQLPGRMEIFERRSTAGRLCRVVLDGAHVDFALAAVLADLRADVRLAGAPVVLLAIGADKDAAAILAPLRGVAAQLVCTPLGEGRRCWPAEELVRLAQARGMVAERADSPADGWRRCLELVGEGWILVTGSLYLVGELRAPAIAGARRLAAPRSAADSARMS